ncbi:hypothetical protein EGW08_013664, partial [Elysia chlorotica]
NHAENRPRSAQPKKLRPSSAQAVRGRPLSANQPRAARVPPASNTNDRVLEYVANSGSPRASVKVKNGKKGVGNAKSSKSNTGNESSNNNNNNNNNTANTNTDTGESTNEASISSSHKKFDDAENDDKYRDRSSSSDRSRSGSGSGSRRDKRSRSNSTSPCRSPRHITETHLKHSNNPALRKWLRRKEKELRKKKKAERAQQMAEELDKQEEKRKRETLFQDSDKKVKEWMVKKRKEAVRQAREESRRQMEEEKEKKEREAVQQQYNSPFRLTERPQSAPSGHVTHHGRKLFIPVIRPERPIAGGNNNSSNGTHQNATSNATETDGNDDKKEENQEESMQPKIPRPPMASKFVYKRPVSGRVRLMKLQQEKKADAKRTELEKMLHEKKLAEEKAKKMRMSYDQWLIKKRSEDYEKRQEAARQRALAKSDPELERIVPEVARRRIENIQRGKRRVATGDKTIDSELNRSFGGEDFPRNGDVHTYGLEVSGSSFKQRPSSAKASLNPRVSKSPRRPQSAHPRVKSVMEENQESQRNAFKLPFPAENGAPKHVLARQEKLFAHHLTHPESSATSTGGQTLQQQQQQKPEESTVLRSTTTTTTTTSGTHENQQAETKDNKNDNEKDEEKETSSSFFVTDGNIGQDDKSRDDICTADVSQEQTQDSIEEDGPSIEEEEEIEPQTEQQDQSPDPRETTEPEKGSNNTAKPNSPDLASEKTDQGNNISTEEVQESTELENDDAKNNQDDNNEEDAESMAKNEDELVSHDTHKDDGSLHLDLDGCKDERIEPDLEEAADKGDKSVDGGATVIGTDTGDQDKEATETLETGLEVRASRHSAKRVSFQNETQVFDYEPSDLGDELDDSQFQRESNDSHPYTGSDDFSDDVDKDDDDDDDDEAEDERGNYFGNETPRDDEF